MNDCTCHRYGERVVLPLERNPGGITVCPVCGQHWILVRWASGPPPGHRGQWSGYTERRLSARRARKLIKAGSAHMVP